MNQAEEEPTLFILLFLLINLLFLPSLIFLLLIKSPFPPPLEWHWQRIKTDVNNASNFVYEESRKRGRERASERAKAT